MMVKGRRIHNQHQYNRNKFGLLQANRCVWSPQPKQMRWGFFGFFFFAQFYPSSLTHSYLDILQLISYCQMRKESDLCQMQKSLSPSPIPWVFIMSKGFYSEVVICHISTKFITVSVVRKAINCGFPSCMLTQQFLNLLYILVRYNFHLFSPPPSHSKWSYTVI